MKIHAKYKHCESVTGRKVCDCFINLVFYNLVIFIFYIVSFNIKPEFVISIKILNNIFGFIMTYSRESLRREIKSNEQ